MHLLLFRNFIQMNHSVLKKIGLLFLIICLIGNYSASAQSKDDNHFIYIQAKNKKPFYVILNRKVFSSSSIGYLIIPKLQDGKYDLRIGFPKQDAPEQNYSCTISGSDIGFSLQKDNEGDLGLLNLQSKTFLASKGSTTLEDQYAAGNTPEKAAVNNRENIVKTKPVKASPDNAAFGQMLSGAINDPTLNKQAENTQTENTQTTTLPKESQKATAPVVVAEVNNQAQANVATDAAQGNVSASDLQDDSQTYGVIKSNEQMTNQGTQMTFVLFNSHSTDTVSVLIPQSVRPDKQVGASETVATPSKKSFNDNSLALFSNTNGMAVEEQDVPVKKRKKKFVDISSNQSADNSNAGSAKTVDNPFYNQSASKTDTASVEEANTPNNVATTSSCDNPLSDKDFSRMQKKMVAKSNDDEMIAIVDKYINGKCITTQQVKQLGGLFLSDAGRFALFQDAYAHVSDKDNYASLQGQLLDQYFKNRFLKMLK